MADRTPSIKPEGVHVAIVMDGNGRWATARGLPRAAGHQQGVETLRAIIEAAKDLGVGYLTVYSFSTENWARPETEIASLFQLLRVYVEKDLDKLREEGVCIRVLGAKDKLPDDIRKIIANVETSTAHNTQFCFNIAFNYGSRDEIVRAIKAMIDGGISGDDIDEALLSQHLYTAHCPDPEIVIRTSGEQRLSNFLLWQCAYSEFFFTDTLWPDFTAAEFGDILAAFEARQRRFGGVDKIAQAESVRVVS